MGDLNLLKAIVDQTAEIAEPGGRFDSADEAVHNVLMVLYGHNAGATLWEPIYEAIKSAYVNPADWGDG